MKAQNQFPLTRKVALAIVVTGLVPASIIGVLAIRTASQMTASVTASYEQDAKHLADKIDRNLFERYGDVQAFGVNDAVKNRQSWYAVGSESNRIANAANHYASLHGFYVLSFMVDLDGKVVAVNDQDPAGKPADTKFLYEKNFKDAEWFKESLAGHFLKSATLDGTFVQSVQADEDVKKIYGGDGLVLGFSAPVKDAEGRPVGVWHNCANFSLVEEIVASTYGGLKNAGLPAAAITVVDAAGRVIVDYNPSANGGQETIVHDPNVLLKANLAGPGFEPAWRVKNVRSGSGIYPAGGPGAEKKKTMIACGFAACEGELGFPGLQWRVLVKVPKADALAAQNTQLDHILVVMALSMVGLIFMGVWLGRFISRPLVHGIQTMRKVGAQVAESADLMSTTSQTVAEAASSQAAALEETSASLEEISSMTQRNAQNAVNGKNLSRQTTDAANGGLEKLAEMGRTLTSIKGAVADMESAVKAMQGSSQAIAKIIKTIDEIAFQTNLLALNAAVEAARAGEAGAGFAVVADEVRALAERSAQAARDTSDKIESAIKRSEIGRAASAQVAKNLTAVEENARNLEQVFNGIVTQIKLLDSAISEISAASQEQTGGISEVNLAVGRMDRVMQNNAASAEENAGVAASLKEQTGTLQRVAGDLEALVNGPAAPARFTTAKAAEKNPTTRAAKSMAGKPADVPGGSRSQSGVPIPMPEPPGSAFKDF